MRTTDVIRQQVEDAGNQAYNDVEIESLRSIIDELLEERLPTNAADLIYGMLTQRVYLRTDDPEHELVASVRERIYPFTSAYAESQQAAIELGIELPPYTAR